MNPRYELKLGFLRGQELLRVLALAISHIWRPGLSYRLRWIVTGQRTTGETWPAPGQSCTLADM